MKQPTSRLNPWLPRLTLRSALMVVIFLAAAALFFFITRVVFVVHSVRFDDWVFGQFDAVRAAWPQLTPVIRALTFFASLPWLVAAGIGIPVLLHRWRHPREGWEVLMAVAGSALLNQLLKVYFQRPRPSSALFFQPGLSFPSGHAMIGLALYGCLAWQLWRHRHYPGWAALLLLFALFIGFTRVYLHVHYATDVLAGFACAVLWLVLLRGAFSFKN